MRPHLPMPPHWDPSRADQIYQVAYEERMAEAIVWREEHSIAHSSEDEQTVCLLVIHAQNSFCYPEGECYVGGESGRAAVDDNIRLCEFIYRELANITSIVPALATHTVVQIFHPVFWLDDQSHHPMVGTVITPESYGREWRINPAVSHTLGIPLEQLQHHAQLYLDRLAEVEGYPLVIQSYHGMLGGTGHALVSIVEEAFFWQSICRSAHTDFQLEGGNPLAEGYSIFGPKVCQTIRAYAAKNTNLIEKLLAFDLVIVAGQAASHSVAWTLADLQAEIEARNKELAHKIHILEDCTSPVVIPGIVDFTEQTRERFEEFRAAGMQLVKSTEAIADWTASVS